MRSVHGYEVRDMLGAAGAAGPVSAGSGRLELGRLASLRGRLPVAIQRRAPTEALSTLLLLVYAWFVISGVVSAVQAMGQPQAPGLAFLSLLYVAFAAAGLWFGANLVV